MKGSKRFAEDAASSDEEQQQKRIKKVDEEDVNALESFVFGNLGGSTQFKTYDDSDAEDSEEEAPAWADSDDEQLKVNITNQYMLKKLRNDQSEKVIDGVEYQERLRAQYEKANGTASWVKSARKEADGDSEEESDDEYGGVDLKSARQRLLRDAAPVVASATGKKTHLGVGALPSRIIDIRRVNDLTITVPCQRAVSKVQFHPTQSQAAVLSIEKTVRLYTADGEKNPCSKQINWANLQLKDFTYSPDGSSILGVAEHSVSIPVLDVATGKTSVVSSLMGHNSKAPFHNIVAGPNPLLEPSLKTSGLVAVSARDGSMHLIDQRTRHVARTYNLTSPNVAVSFYPGKDMIVTASGPDATVCIWDVRSNGRCLKRFTDTSAFNITAMQTSPSAATPTGAGSWLATGSKSGIVSLYGIGSSVNPEDGQGALITKQPIKAVQNLTTQADVMAFHPSSELLAVGSTETSDALKLIHLPSATVMQNWPTAQTPLKKVTALAFSADGRWMCAGNHQGTVGMFEVSHFAAKLAKKD